MLTTFEKIDGKNIVVIQIKSEFGYKEDQQKTLRGLGLKGVNTKSELKCDKAIYGMLFKVKHLIDVKIK
ncbi:MAG TPA: 50S ribosomal protein L30 [Rickettsiales bacterium]|nr:50S ribosomal protein L30 [Rickettsiales bacterium]